MRGFIYKTLFANFFCAIYAISFISQAAGQENVLKSETIQCGDGKHSYVVYLPHDYNISKKWPVLFCFDAIGNGELTAMVFSSAAVNQKWIVAGSLDVKNGPWKPVTDVIQATLDDVLHRYRVDTGRFYATGFSGGTYASYMIAYAYPEYFRGVISCGAGLGPDNMFMRNVSKKVAVFHCLGTQDFKYDEVIKAHQYLTEVGVRSKLRLY